MKNLILLPLLFIAHFLCAQVVSIDYLMSFPEERTPVYSRAHATNVCYLQMNFAQSKILKPSAIKAFVGHPVERIDLVYTQYVLKEDFNQPSLNKDRLEELKKWVPELFNNSAIKWHFLAQTRPKSPEEAARYFHGFVITFKREPTPAATTAEFRTLDVLMKKVETDETLIPVKKVETEVYRRHSKIYYLPKSEKKILAGITYRKKGIWKRKRVREIWNDTFIKVVEIPDESAYVPGTMISQTYGMDSTIMKVLDRHRDWRNMMIVGDLTGSMMPYSAQLLVWQKLNWKTTNAEHFVFFNDGDNKPDNLKVIGKTGGIYYTHASTYEDMERTARTTMRNGNGGDGPENNIEALLKALDCCPDCENVVMIADNFAPVKDIRLLPKVSKPVKIIICGFNGWINADYLKIARSTGGSIHTMEQDLYELAKLNEGDILEIGSQKFLLRNGEFVLTR